MMTPCSNTPRLACLTLGALTVTFLAALLSTHSILGQQWFYYAEPLKQSLLVAGAVFALMASVFVRPQGRLPALWLLALPFLAALPGAFLHSGQWNYHAYAEIINTGLALAWVALWFYAWRDRNIAAQKAAWLLALGVALTVLWSMTQWALAGFSGAPATNFGNQNYASNFVILAVPFVFYQAFVSAGRARRVWLAIGVVSVLALFVVFQTRAAILGFAIASFAMLAVWMGVKHARRSLWLAWWTPVVLFLLAVWVLSQFYWQLAAEYRFLQLAGPHAWYPRTFPWMIGWQSVLDAPWLGHGLGASWSLFSTFQDTVPEVFAVATSTDYLHIHSEYLEWAQEGGALGVATYLLVWAWVAWNALRIALNATLDTATRALAAAALYGLIAFHLHSLVEVSARMPVNHLALIITGAIVMSLKPRATPTDTPAVSRWTYLFPALALLPVAWALTVELPRQHDTFMAINAPALIEQDTLWRNRINNSDSVEALYHRAIYKLYTRRDTTEVTELLDRIERRIPKFRELEYLRFHSYLLERQGQSIDLQKLGAMLNTARQNSRYLPIVEHFSAQFGAHSGNRELLLEVLEDRLFRAAIAYKVALADRREDVRLRVDTNGSGFAMSYSQDKKLTFLMGMPQLDLLMAIASETMTETAAFNRLSEVPLKIRVSEEPTPGFKEALTNLSKDYVLGFAVLVAPPKELLTP
jgi:O-antigen ligase